MTANSRTVHAILRSNSNSPPPAIPPLGVKKKDANLELRLSLPTRYVGGLEEAGCDGATITDNPKLLSGFANALVKLAESRSQKCVPMSCIQVTVTG